MEKEFKFLEFPSTVEGQLAKAKALEEYKQKGWVIDEEIITTADLNVKKASRDAACACLFCGICAPFVVDADKHRIPSTIRITLSHTTEARAEAEKAESEENRMPLEQDTKNASLKTIVDNFKEAPGDGYISQAVIKGIQLYLQSEREAFGPIPSLLHSKRKGEFVLVADLDGNCLARYKIVDLNHLPDIAI